jgi:hypothetical protein
MNIIRARDAVRLVGEGAIWPPARESDNLSNELAVGQSQAGKNENTRTEHIARLRKRLLKTHHTAKA